MCGKLEIYEVNGNHDSYLGEYVQTTAVILRIYIDSLSDREENKE
jgi:hypothetical protein